MRAALVLLAVLLAGCAAPPLAPPPAEPGWAWRSFADGPTPRTEVAAATLDGRIFVLGGFNAAGDNVRLVEIYDPATNRWSRGPDYPIPVHHVALVATEEALLAFGGFTTAAFVPTALAFRLPLGGTTWEPLPMLPAPRAAGAGALLDGNVYLVGGFGLGQQLTPRVDVFDVGARTWAQGPDLPTPRDHLAAAALQGRVWAIGGEEGGHDANVDTVESLDPARGSWQAGAPLPRPRGSLSGAAFEGRLVALGGQDLEVTYQDADVYDPVARRWSPLPPMPTARHGLGVAVADGKVYALLGGPQPGQSVTGAVEALELVPG